MKNEIENWKEYKTKLYAQQKIESNGKDGFKVNGIIISNKEAMELIAKSETNALFGEQNKIFFVVYSESSETFNIFVRYHDNELKDKFKSLINNRDKIHNLMLEGIDSPIETNVHKKLGLNSYIKKDSDGEIRAYVDDTESDDMVGLMSAIFNGNPQMASMMIDKMYESIPSSMLDATKSKLDNLKEYMAITK